VFQISVVLTSSKKKNTCDKNFQKVYQKPSLLEQMLKMLSSKPNGIKTNVEADAYSC
jgi:hypothetical protein